MKNVLIGLLVLVVLAGVAVFALPLLVSVDWVKDRLTARFEAATGREVRIDGPAELSLFPSITVGLTDVRVANAAGGTADHLLELRHLDLDVGLWALLGGEIDVERLILRRPVLALEVDAQGRPNWLPVEGPAAPAAPAEPAADGAVLPEALRLGDARIVDGTVSYADARSGEAFAATDIDLEVALPGLDRPLAAEGRAVVRDEPVALSLAVARVRELLAGGAAPVELTLTSAPLTIAFDGTVGTAPAAQGALRVTVPSLPDLADRLGTGGTDTLPFESIDLAGQIEADPAAVTVSGLDGTLGDIGVGGRIEARLDRPRPLLAGRLTLGAFSLESFAALAAPDGGTPEGAAGGGEAEGPAPGAGGGWPAALRLTDLDLEVQLRAVAWRGTAFGPAVVAVTVDSGVAAVQTGRVPAFDGTVALDLTADAAAETPRVAIDAVLDAIDLGAALDRIAGLEGAAGRLSAELALTASGIGAEALAESLSAQGAFTLAGAYALPPVEGDADTDMGEPASVSAAGTLSLSRTAGAVELDRFEVAGIAGSGALAVTGGDVRPFVSGRLDIADIDLDPLLLPPSGEVPADAADPDPGWSTEPIDLSPLRLADADLGIRSGRLTARGVTFGPADLTVTVADGIAAARLAETPLFGGTAALALDADASGPVPALDLRLDLAGIAADGLPGGLAGIGWLSGTVDAAVAVSSVGVSPQALVAGLDGGAELRVADGAIAGINIPALLRDPIGAVAGPGAPIARRTDFSELSATFAVTDGVARTDDLRLLAPLVRADGRGEIGLPTRTLAFRLFPRLVATPEGQGGAPGAAGMGVPIVVEGPIGDVRFRLDLDAVYAEAGRDPAGFAERLGALGAGARERMLEALAEGAGGEALDAVQQHLSRAAAGDGAPRPEPAGEPPAGGTSRPGPDGPAPLPPEPAE